MHKIFSMTHAHPSWLIPLSNGLDAVHRACPGYLEALQQTYYLPTQDRLFAAFCQPLPFVRYVLVGEAPYPREESAIGLCFMDGAVNHLWSDQGLSTRVNRATSLRNFLKMLLVAQGILLPDQTAKSALLSVVQQVKSAHFIQTLAELQENLLSAGFLLLNATLVYRADHAAAKEAKAWRPFLENILHALLDHAKQQEKIPPVLVLWGRTAGQLQGLSCIDSFPKAIAEHPYNLSFIQNAQMHDLFGKMRLLRRLPP